MGDLNLNLLNYDNHGWLSASVLRPIGQLPSQISLSLNTLPNLAIGHKGHELWKFPFLSNSRLLSNTKLLSVHALRCTFDRTVNFWVNDTFHLLYF